MALKFYKELSTGKWRLGDGYYPSGIIAVMQTNISVTFSAPGGLRVPEDEYPYTSIIKEDGSAYGTRADFDAATSSFFVFETTTIQSSIQSLITAVQSGGTQLKSFAVEFTRPSNATAYTAGDLVGDVTTTFKTISNVAKATGTGVRIYRVRLQTNDTGIADGTKFNVHLYNDVPDITGLSDNSAFSINYANATKRIGKIPVVFGSLVGMNDYNMAGVNPVGRDIIAVLETASAFTPSGNSTKITLVLDCELSNL